MYPIGLSQFDFIALFFLDLNLPEHKVVFWDDEWTSIKKIDSPRNNKFTEKLIGEQKDLW